MFTLKIGVTMRTFVILFISFFFFFSSFINAQNINIDRLVSESKKLNKHVLLFFHKDGCAFCEKMSEDTLGDVTIEDIVEKKFIYIDIGINDEGSIIHRDFHGSKYEYAKSLEVGFYPTVGFVDGNNSIVYGAIGYQDIKSFSVLLEYIQDRHYMSMDLEEFRNNVDFESDD